MPNRRNCFFNATPEEAEKQIEALNKQLSLDFKRTSGVYDIFDAIDETNNSVMECKRRTCCATSWDDTIIGLNKYECWKNKYSTYNFYATFMFEDGLYYFKFDNHKSLEEQGLYTTRNHIDVNYNNHTDYEKEHINIPTEMLMPLGNSTKIIPRLKKGVCYLNTS